MEMSVGTIVTVVLLMAVLILGIFLVQKIFRSAHGAIDLTNQQLQDQIVEIFGKSEAPIAIYPPSKYLDISKGKIDAIGIGIKGPERGGTSQTYSYSIEAKGSDNERNCGVGNSELSSYIKQGSSETGLDVGPGDIVSRKVRFEIPEDAPLCLVRYVITVTSSGDAGSKTDYVDINIK